MKFVESIDELLEDARESLESVYKNHNSVTTRVYVMHSNTKSPLMITVDAKDLNTVYPILENDSKRRMAEVNQMREVLEKTSENVFSEVERTELEEKIKDMKKIRDKVSKNEPKRVYRAC